MYSSTLFNNLHICTNKSIPNYSTYYTHSAKHVRRYPFIDLYCVYSVRDQPVSWSSLSSSPTPG